MRHPTRRSMKNLIYLEMILLSALLVVAVVVVSRFNKPAFSNDGFYTDNNTVLGEESSTQATQPLPTWKTFPEDRALTARQYFVFDCKKQEFLTISGQADERIYPASITKLFTAYTIIQTSILGPNEIFTAGEDVLALVADGSSVAHIQTGDRLTAQQLVEGMLLSSGNDAAYILACEAGRRFADQPNLEAASAVQVFVAEMNRFIKEKGLQNTNLVNPDGIHDPNHYTTAQDLVILSGLCMQYGTIMDPAIAPEADIRLHGETIIWKNTNELINPKSEYYCPYAIGLKTGQTPAAGSCLLSAFKKDGQYLLIGVFGCPETNDRFDDALQLFNQTVLK